MKLGPVTTFDKKNTATSKKFDDDFMRKIVVSLSFPQLMANLQLSRRRIPDAWFIKLTISLTKIFYLRKPGNRTRKSITRLSYYYFE